MEIFLKRDSLSWVDDGADVVEGTKAEAVATDAATRRAENFIATRMFVIMICEHDISSS